MNNDRASRILQSLVDIQNIMLNSIKQILNRGEELHILEKKSDDVMKTSELFMFQTIPWYEKLYKRTVKKLCFCPLWWFRC